MPPPAPQSACPHCGVIARRLDLLSLQFKSVDYFRCLGCQHVWKSAKHVSPRDTR
jgi:hypothetical protein